MSIEQVITRKSVRLTSRQQRKLERLQKQHLTKIEVAEQLGITRQTLDRILVTGRCHPTTAEKINAA